MMSQRLTRLILALLALVVIVSLLLSTVRY
jgi:hypothetical protein